MRADVNGAAQAFSTALDLLEDHPDAVQEAAVHGLLADLTNRPGGARGRQNHLALAQEASVVATLKSPR